MTRAPLPIFPTPGQRVRIAYGHVVLDADTSAERTAISWVKGAPQQDEHGCWHIPVTGHGLVQAGRVRVLA